MEEFRKQGGVLGGRGEKYDGFEGEPRAIGKALGGHDHSHTGPTAPHGTAGLSTGTTGSSGLSSDNYRTSDFSSDNRNATGTGVGGGALGSGTTHDSTTTTKPSMMDKLNPKKDADGDGKAGFMS